MTITAALSSDTIATSCGISVNSGSPELALCRKLDEAGHDPSTSLQAYRGDVLCLRVRSIGEAAGLRVATAGTGFICPRGPTSGLPVSLIELSSIAA